MRAIGWQALRGLAVGVIAAAAACAEGGLRVTVLPMPAAEQRTFDPAKPPGALADPTRPGDLPGPPVDAAGKPLVRENAFTAYEFQTTDSTFRFRGDVRRRIQITSATVTLSGATVMYLPVDAIARLLAHERGHDVLVRYAYGRLAPAEIEKALAGFVGSSFARQRGKDARQAAEEVFAERLRQAGAAIKARIDELGQMFDRLTEGGLGRRVDATAGVEKAKEWFEKTSPAETPHSAERR